MNSTLVRRALAVLVIPVGVTALTLAPVASAYAWDSDGWSADDAVTLTARESRAAEDAWNTAKSAGDPGASLVEYARAKLCDVSSAVLTTSLNGPCPPASAPVPLPSCGNTITALEALWTRTRTTPSTPWTPWTFLTGASCPQDVLPALSTEDFRRLPLTPTPTTIQPSTGIVLVSYGIIVTADPTPQDLTTTLLGYPITVHATPTQYTWDFGDHSPPLTTTDPGTPYPTDGTTPPTPPGSIYPHGPGC